MPLTEEGTAPLDPHMLVFGQQSCTPCNQHEGAPDMGVDVRMPSSALLHQHPSTMVLTSANIFLQNERIKNVLFVPPHGYVLR